MNTPKLIGIPAACAFWTKVLLTQWKRAA